VWATPIADVLFGRGRYPEAANVLRALAPFVFLSGFGNLFSLAANFLGQARKRVPIALLTVVVNCGMDIILIPRIGVVAGAIGTDVAYALYAPAHVWICASVLGVSLKPLIRPTAWTTVAAGSMCGTLALLGTGHLGIARIAGGAIAATTLYLAVILLSRTLTQNERRKLLLQLRRRSRRTGEGLSRRRSL
jgi:O-antigen/teichoic acid export membrane protein